MTIGEKFGLSPEMWGTVSAKQLLFNSVATSTVIKEDGKTWENLVSITEDDIKEWGVEGEPQEGRIPISKYMEDGIYRVDRHIGDNFGYIDKKEFREDPEANPIGTNSGKIEFANQTWADILNSQGFSEEPYSAIPKYRVPTQGYEDTFVDGKLDGEKTEFPLQCINPHYQRRSHSIFDNIPWLREAMHNPVSTTSPGFVKRCTTRYICRRRTPPTAASPRAIPSRSRPSTARHSATPMSRRV